MVGLGARRRTATRRSRSGIPITRDKSGSHGRNMFMRMVREVLGYGERETDGQTVAPMLRKGAGPRLQTIVRRNGVLQLPPRGAMGEGDQRLMVETWLQACWGECAATGWS